MSMSERCAETIQQRRGTVSLRCDRHAEHQQIAAGLQHYDAAQDATWFVAHGELIVHYAIEPWQE